MGARRARLTLTRHVARIATAVLTKLCPVNTSAGALAYTLGPLLGPGGPSIPWVVAAHGWAQAVGFVLGGLLAWTLEQNARAGEGRSLARSRVSVVAGVQRVE